MSFVSFINCSIGPGSHQKSEDEVKGVRVKQVLKRLLDAGGPMRGNKQPDWLCRECQNKNFGWREVCNRCQVVLPLPHLILSVFNGLELVAI